MVCHQNPWLFIIEPYTSTSLWRFWYGRWRRDGAQTIRLLNSGTCGGWEWWIMIKIGSLFHITLVWVFQISINGWCQFLITFFKMPSCNLIVTLSRFPVQCFLRFWSPYLRGWTLARFPTRGISSRGISSDPLPLAATDCSYNSFFGATISLAIEAAPPLDSSSTGSDTSSTSLAASSSSITGTLHDSARFRLFFPTFCIAGSSPVVLIVLESFASCTSVDNLGLRLGTSFQKKCFRTWPNNVLKGLHACLGQCAMAFVLCAENSFKEF